MSDDVSRVLELIRFYEQRRNRSQLPKAVWEHGRLLRIRDEVIDAGLAGWAVSRVL